mgnify:CR=1 FL=1
MSIKTNKTLVAQLTLNNNTYYVTDMYGITLDNIEYKNLVLSWSNVSFKAGQVFSPEIKGGGFEISTLKITMAFGEQFMQGGFPLDVTDVWNNSKCTVRRWEEGIHAWNDCAYFYQGMIKDFTVNDNVLSFDIDGKNEQDDTMLPMIVVEDQSDINDADAQSDVWLGVSGFNYVIPYNNAIFSETDLVRLSNKAGQSEFARVLYKKAESIYFTHNLQYNYSYDNGGKIEKAFRHVMKDNVGKTLPIQIGNLSDTHNGVFGKFLLINNKIGEQALLADCIPLNSLISIGCWERGMQKYFCGRSEINIESYLSHDTIPEANRRIYVKNAGVFTPGMPITISDAENSENCIVESVHLPSTGITNGYLMVTSGLLHQYRVLNNAKVSMHQGEFALDTIQNNRVQFLFDSNVTIDIDLNDTDDITNIALSSGGAKALRWIREDSHLSGTGEIPELLSPLIIRIGDELMLLLEEPDKTNDTIWVERGYGGTTKSEHNFGDAVYQIPNFASKNLITFRHRFDPISISNFYWGVDNIVPPYQDTPNKYAITPPSRLLGDGSTFFRFYQKQTVHYGMSSSWLSFDLKFQKIEDSYSVIGIYPSYRISGSVDIRNKWSGGSPVSYKGNGSASILLGVAGLNSGQYNTQFETLSSKGLIYIDSLGSSGIYEAINCIETLDDDDHKGSWELLSQRIGAAAGFTLSTLTDLNRRWKFYIICKSVGEEDQGWIFPEYTVDIYKLALWLDFALDFTKKIVVGAIKGRNITDTVIAICGDDSPSRIGELCENPVDVTALILTQELQYSSDDFTANWSTTRSYFADSSNFEEGSVPKVAVSYGISDSRLRGWELCEWIASHFNIMLIRDYEGKIDIVNLHEIYYNTPSGTEINIEEIRFLRQSGTREFTLRQTGTDLLYNDFQIKWRRNNSTNEYQQTYHMPDSYSLLSGNSIKGAREQFYQGGKRTLELESPFIYNEDDAIRKAAWEANDKAECKFYVTFVIDGDHWDEVAGRETQYKVGDIIYFRGKASGVNFTATQQTARKGKFYITEISLEDKGSDLRISAKSLQPCTEFTADLDGDSSKIVWDDTGGTSISGNAIKDDTGGTNITGKNIKDDTGG